MLKMTTMRAKYPNNSADMSDFREAVKNYVLPGYIPDTPIFGPGAKIATAGSCFAQNLTDALTRAKIKAQHMHYSEDYNSAPATAVLIDEILSGAHGDSAVEILRKATAFVLTIGIALAPFKDGKPVFRVTKSNALEIEWRMVSPNEISNYISQMIERIRSVNPEITVVLTESPLPLNVSVGHLSVVGQDCLSKSSIRVGIEMVIQQKRPRVFYWPSFEMVRWLSPHRGKIFGEGEADNRHIPQSMVDEITRLFIEIYFRSSDN